MSNPVHAEHEEYGLFVGNSLMFSNTVLRLAANEIDCLHFSREKSFDNLFAIPPARARHCRLLVFDETFCEKIGDHVADLCDHFARARLGIAYRDPDSARDFMSQVRHDRHFREIGFLPMDLDADLWMTVLRLLILGKGYIPHELLLKDNEAAFPSGPVSQKQGDPVHAGLAVLTAREKQVLAAVSEGKQNKIIAAELKLSEHTVKLHLHKIISKLGVNNRTEAAICYLAERGGSNGEDQ